jgi:hypothetical protein
LDRPSYTICRRGLHAVANEHGAEANFARGADSALKAALLGGHVVGHLDGIEHTDIVLA